MHFYLEHSWKIYETLFGLRENNVKIRFKWLPLPTRHKREVTE